MKKLLLILLTIGVLVVQTSCSSNSTAIINDTDTIAASKLTDREKMFLSASNELYFVFDFIVGEKFKWIDVWIDRYELGKLVSSNTKQSSGILEGKEGLILAALTQDETSMSNWIISIKQGGATSTNKHNQGFKSADLKGFAKTWQTINKEIKIEEGKEITLASACFKDMESGSAVSSLTEEFYSNPADNIKEIKDYKLVYLLKARFYEKAPY